MRADARHNVSTSFDTSRIRVLLINFGLLSGAELASKLFTFIAFAFLARLFGPATYGQLEFVIQTVFLLSLSVDFGFGVYGAREVSKDPQSVHSITQSVVYYRFMFAILSLLVLVAFSFAAGLSGDFQALLWLFGISLLPVPFLLQWVFQAHDWMHHVGITQLLRYGTFGTVVLLCVKGPSHLWYVAIAEIAGITVAAAYTMAIYRVRIGRLPFFSWRRPGRHILLSSLPIAISQLLWAARYIFVIVLLGLVTTPGSVGMFAAALRIVVALHMFNNMYFYNLMPSASRSIREPSANLQDMLHAMMRLSSWCCLPLAIAASILARPLISLIYGPSFDDAGRCFQIILWMLPLSLLSTHYRVTLIAYGRQTLEMLANGIAAIVHLALILTFFSQWGLIGVSVAMLTGEFVGLVLVFLFVHRHVSYITTWTALMRPALAGMAVAACLMTVSTQSTWVRLILVFLIMASALLLLERKALSGFTAFLHRLCMQRHSTAP